MQNYLPAGRQAAQTSCAMKLVSLRSTSDNIACQNLPNGFYFVLSTKTI